MPGALLPGRPRTSVASKLPAAGEPATSACSCTGVHHTFNYLQLHGHAAYESCHGHSMTRVESTAAVCMQILVSLTHCEAEIPCLLGFAERQCTCHLAADL